MRGWKLWTCLFHITLVCMIAERVLAAPPLSTIQDVLYKADGTLFNGNVYIDWASFQAADQSTVAAQNMVVPVVNGNLRVRLVPTSNASVGAHYVVRYHSDGRIQFNEQWDVPPSAGVLHLSDVRASNGASTGGGSTAPSSLTITDIAGLNDELTLRPVKGFSYGNNRVLKTGPTGALETVTGADADCVRVDGSAGSCGSNGGGGGGSAAFADSEVPAGLANGSNTVFTLTQAPYPAASLQLHRNGVLLMQSVDYTLSGNTVTMSSLAAPQSGDLLLASYRVAGTGGQIAADTGAAPGSISDNNVSATARIAESKLALNFPTHSNANDPDEHQKQAMVGTAGMPSGVNRYVTSQDARLSDARPAAPHNLLGAAHSDTNPGDVSRGDLIVGQGARSSKWARLPIGQANRCLMSNGQDVVWNTCLFTNFSRGAVPFIDGNGNLSQNIAQLYWDANARRFSLGTSLALGTLTIHDETPGTGSTTVVVRGGQGQNANALQIWQSGNGGEVARVSSNGALEARGVESLSTISGAAWRENGTALDPVVRANGDAWLNIDLSARKSHEGGQTHTGPQVICSATGGSTNLDTAIVAGTCTVPAGMMKPGDRFELQADLMHSGSATGASLDVKWGAATWLSRSIDAADGVFAVRGSSSLSGSGTLLTVQSWGSSSVLSSNAAGAGGPSWGSLTVSFTLQMNSATADVLQLSQFTLIRYPAQSNN